MDKHGYPTDDELERVAKWDFKDKDGWFEYINSLWSDTYGIFRCECDGELHRYELITGGWSGNESIIAAMTDNYVLWSLYWTESHRGGLYKFEVK
ncbi:MAG: hypothetical protein Q8O19_06440 [Rectinemataceae bacterium]|nr:hypothetical protein [Rectinemataceae bacterium]